ncbi:GTP-binding protein [Pseudomonas sp. LRF_L74]|uniref:GTP-binding protein n=1 Tax=Pseudomonas sp. LRF_L74 TaxID=3369422 RepID=UPI003F6300BC
MNSMHNASDLPVTALAGFLGAGTSTWLGHLLNHRQERRRAAIVNAMPEPSIGVDCVGEGGRVGMHLAGRAIDRGVSGKRASGNLYGYRQP